MRLRQLISLVLLAIENSEQRLLQRTRQVAPAIRGTAAAAATAAATAATATTATTATVATAATAATVATAATAATAAAVAAGGLLHCLRLVVLPGERHRTVRD